MSDRIRGLRLLALLLLCGLMGACASMLPKLEPPVLSVTGVDIVGGTLQQQQLHLRLHVVNPNARAIAVRGIDCNLELEGQPFATGATDAAFTLPAAGETDFGLNVTANLNTALLALLSGLGHKSVDYHLYGEVHYQRSRLRLGS
jgi:LEA14-like dessication related protein